MGNAESGGGGASGDEEDVETESPGFAEDSPASAATAVGVGGGGCSGSGRSGRGSNNPPVPTGGPPSPGVLLEQVKLREAAARISDSGVAIQESVLAGNEGVLVRWLEDRLNRGEESVNVEQFCEMLESRDAPRDECEEAFGQFDAEGDGVVDVESMLIALKNSNGANLKGELSHVIRQLQACSLTPGFVDIFSKTKDRLGAHASKILKFLHRNRIPSSAIPFPILEGYNSICTMRSSVVQDFLEALLQKEKGEQQTELDRDPEVDKVKVVTQCYSTLEASSNVADVYKMTNGETASFWQSDGSARSHWIRLKMKPDVVLRRLAIAVASNDHSYMPQLVSVAVGKNRRSLQEIRDIRIPSNVTGYVALLENANITHPYIQINIKRCLSDGCDTRIHGLKTLGYQITKSKEVSVSDASAIWYLSLLTSLVTASMETNPALAQTVLQSTQKALRHMPPLSLTPSSTEFPKFFSLNILEEVDGFLLRIADCCVSPDAELTLLAFALARGSVAKVLQALSCISDHLKTEYKASSLIVSLASVRLRLLNRNGKPLQLHLQACDMKSKEEKSGPENMLTESSTGDGFLTESGRKRASVILSTEDQSNFQITQMKIKVRKGTIGAKCGSLLYVKIPTQSEDEPIGWFELEDDWNDVEIKLQQCRVAKFLMVKFLCTRQDSAERLGVQSLTFSGYLCPGPERLGDLDNLSPEGDSFDCDAVAGLCLLNKTLFFIQQLTRDMDASHFKQKYLLDFSGLGLNLFWNFYSKLREIRILLLQLMQNCFPMLPNSLEPRGPEVSRGPDEGAPAATCPSTSKVVEDLCSNNMCDVCVSVVDGPEGETLVEKALHKEAVKAILNGAAVFFPDKHVRRDKLFHMMVMLWCVCVCVCSDQDPSGLLLLPPKGAPSDFDISPIRSVMETLLLVATRECEVMMADENSGASRTVLLSLFWALQGSLVSWCYLQLKGGASTTIAMELARDILLKYVDQFLGSIKGVLSSLLGRHTGAEITDKLCSSILATVFRQLMILLLELCSLDIPHSVLLRSFSSLVELLKSLSSDTGDIFSKVDQESWHQPQQPVVLRTWSRESPHNYENSRHETSIFACPGATSFEVEFDERCETEKRYDYLEFTDSRGGKVRYDMKVGSEKWPKKVTFDAGPQLQFLFHSDSSNNEWGYKFTVTALGLPDITISWMSDLQLLVARLMGRLASRTLALKSPHEIRTVKDLPPGKMSHVQSSPLWKPILRHGLCETRETDSKTPTDQFHSEVSIISFFLEDFARWNPSLEPTDSRTKLMKTLMQSCRKQPMRNEIAAGPKSDQAVNAIWAAMVYHTAALNNALKNCGNEQNLCEEFVQVYSLADSIRTWMLEMKQRYLVSKLNVPDEKEGGHDEVSMETLAEMCIEKSLLLFRFTPCGAPCQDGGYSKAAEGSNAPLLRSSSISEGDFQASSSLGQQAAGSEEGGEARAGQSQPCGAQVQNSSSCGHSRQGHRGSTESLSSQSGDPASPSAIPRKAPFSRARLRLLSCRSLEEPRMAPAIKDRYPILKHILNFIKDQALTTASILQTLSLSKAQALSVCKVLEMVQQCLHSLGKPHLFQAPCILFLQELLACQKDFTSYFSQLSDSGQKLGEEVRRSYHQLVLMLVEAVQGFSSLNEKALLPALSCVQTCLLHLLDMSWEVQDLDLFLNIKLPDLLLSMSQENISVHDIAISQWTEEDEIADYKKNQEWMDECMDGMFEKWYDKIDEEDSVEDRRKMHMFIARYCDLLNVVISCDGCERMAPWHRYRCLQCMDMDLCKTCFLSGAKPEGHEDDHEMVNMEYACDHCQGLIVGSRINCNVCEDFDLCFGCYNAKKYPDSHLPTHRITVYPMVTIRISDRHRLIQPYIHNYSWLLFAALALYTSELSSQKQMEGESLDSKTLSQASALQTHSSQLITDCLLKGQTGKGKSKPGVLRTPSLLSSDVSTDTSSTRLSAALIMSISGSNYPLAVWINLVCPFCIYILSFSASELGPGTVHSAATAVVKGTDERLPQVPLQEHVFSECSRERILGLLAAMLPPAKPGSTLSLPSLNSILPKLFRAVISNAGSLNETYHLTLGLLGQLLLRIPPMEADTAVTEALADKYDLLTQGEAASSDTHGWKTTQLLFSLGAVCLDSRIGLDWACTVADILHSLNACPEWSTVIAAFTDHCIQQLPQTLKRTNLFTLLVLVGFPEVLCVGTQTVFIDNANEQHNMILLKHFTEKNHAAVVDVKTRKRKTVKDYQLIQSQDSTAAGLPGQSEGQGSPNTLSRYLSNFNSIISHLLQASQDNGSPDAVEASWVLSLALKGLYNTLKKHGVEQSQEDIQQSGLTQLLVRKCSKGTGFSKLWLLRDLEILSIMLYSSKREIHSMAQDPERDQREQDKEHDSDHSSCCADDTDVSKPDPLEGLDEETKICFQITHDALNAPLPILRAMYELQMKRTDSFFLEVQKRFDGEEIKTDEMIRTLAQKWQPTRRPRSEERNTKAVDTDMIVVSCVSKPSHCEKATEEVNVVAQKLITNSESDLQLSYAKQRRTKSSALLHKELDVRSNRAVRQYLVKVNQAIATLYARHVLASLLADWPAEAALSEEALELSGASHMAYILDMLMQLEERPLWEKILQRVLKGCSQSMLCSLSLTACQFMEEPGMAVQIRESKHPYDNNTNFEDKVHIPGAIYLSVKFDSRCNTEEGCDELIMSSSSDFLQDVHNFSGSPQKWSDFEIPGDTLYYRFMSDMSNTEWGYKFTVTGGHRGRFQTGFEILKQMLADEQVLSHLPLADIWEWQVGVACRQTGNQRLKAIHLLLRLLQCQSQTACELTLLRPLWQLFMSMENSLSQDPTSITVLLPLHRALTELFFIAEARAQGILQEYLLAMTTDEQLLNHTALKNIAAISLAINYPNKSTKLLNMSS
uniref:Zinc finger ZZ-type and EF-hand domain containing 1 n=1 Tax=Cyclopterus lumpus TaxID=8103 RepID=A0A8C2ZSW0_CYCLU